MSSLPPVKLTHAQECRNLRIREEREAREARESATANLVRAGRHINANLLPGAASHATKPTYNYCALPRRDTRAAAIAACRLPAHQMIQLEKQHQLYHYHQEQQQQQKQKAPAATQKSAAGVVGSGCCKHPLETVSRTAALDHVVQHYVMSRGPIPVAVYTFQCTLCGAKLVEEQQPLDHTDPSVIKKNTAAASAAAASLSPSHHPVGRGVLRQQSRLLVHQVNILNQEWFNTAVAASTEDWGLRELLPPPPPYNKK